MYRTCLHCHGPLGENEVVEHFPVGKRLAYDAAKGRLWVVCAKCQRWNLTPLEERWEAIEECEREFEQTSMRASTDNIVLARTRSGIDLVRIGAPSYPEFAAWRYGRILRERWKRTVIPGAALLTSVWGLQIANATGGMGFWVGSSVVALIAAPIGLRRWWASRASVMLPTGRVTRLEDLGDGVRLEADGDGAWALRLTDWHGTERATGTDAVHAMRSVLTSVNIAGGIKREVEAAASLVERLGGSGSFVAKVARATERHAEGNLRQLPTEARLGLEMALHADSERAAMSGELAGLIDEWKKADEIARIADEMFLPRSISEGLARLKSR